jgi:hypothetical protein
MSISDVEWTFEAQYKLHPSVFQNSPLIIPKEIQSAVDLRADFMDVQHPYLTENVESANKNRELLQQDY